MHAYIIAYGLLAVVTLRCLQLLYQSLISPTRNIPGPILARFSRLWYLSRIYSGSFHQENIELHRKYGPVVRVAPGMFSITTPDKAVYGIGSKFPKSAWYEGWKHPSPDKWTLFVDRDIKRHSDTRKRFQGMYSMSSLVSYESYVETCTDIFSQRLTEFAATGEAIDFGHWLLCYAFDVIGEITYSRRFGFLDKGEDVGGVLAALQASMVYSTCVGVYEAAHPYLYEITQKIPGSGAAGRNYIMRFAQQRINDRNEVRKKSLRGEKSPDVEEGTPQDFLDKIINAHEENPEKVTDYHIFMMGVSNLIAGSDTTAVSLSSIFYHLIRYPQTLQKLREEISEFESQGRCSKPYVKFQESQEMPYLQAVMKEALRMHSATGLPLWREVPDGGAEVCGRFFPAGSTIGINTWVAHSDESVFGPDAKHFRPERWLEAEKEGGERFKNMEAHYMPFGLGSRTCIGRHISILEMSKLVPQLVRTFDFELESAAEEWKTENLWFVKPKDFKVRVKHRSQRS